MGGCRIETPDEYMAENTCSASVLQIFSFEGTRSILKANVALELLHVLLDIYEIPFLSSGPAILILDRFVMHSMRSLREGTD